MEPRSAVVGGRKCHIGCRGRTRTPPLGPSVELPMGPRGAVLGGLERMRAVAPGPSVEFPMGPRR
eukprot:9429446-Pyramimonas_sp.AAC.1